MYDILQLNEMLVPELRELADSLGMKSFKKLSKQDLIYRILDEDTLVGDDLKLISWKRLSNIGEGFTNLFHGLDRIESIFFVDGEADAALSIDADDVFRIFIGEDRFRHIL